MKYLLITLAIVGLSIMPSESRACDLQFRSSRSRSVFAVQRPVRRGVVGGLIRLAAIRQEQAFLRELQFRQQVRFRPVFTSPLLRLNARSFGVSRSSIRGGGCSDFF